MGLLRSKTSVVLKMSAHTAVKPRNGQTTVGYCGLLEGSKSCWALILRFVVSSGSRSFPRENLFHCVSACLNHSLSKLSALCNRILRAKLISSHSHEPLFGSLPGHPVNHVILQLRPSTWPRPTSNECWVKFSTTIRIWLQTSMSRTKLACSIHGTKAPNPSSNNYGGSWLSKFMIV
jgi:hypothetical protein